MKNILILIVKITLVLSFSLSSLRGITQVDSSLLKISFSLRANDIEFITAYFTNEHEDFYDAAKVKFRVVDPPGGITLVVVDSVPVYQLLAIALILRNNPGAVTANLYSRYSTVIRALGHSYIARKMDEGDNAVISTVPQMRKVGRFILRRKED
jgi:hypothetical protein